MARDFREILAEINNGGLLAQLGEKMAYLVKEVTSVEKGGTLTIKLSVKPNGDRTVFLDADVTVKAPNAPIETSVFFHKENGDLTRRDPDQDQLNIRDNIRAIS